MTDDILAIFVYGTLQRGEERERCWPFPPQRIDLAEIRAELYDLGAYPAIIAGRDRVVGECWKFAPPHLAGTLEVLDEIEGYGQGDVDLYIRRVVECRTVRGERVTAYTYFYAREDEARSYQRVIPSPDGFCRWHRYLHEDRS